MKTISIKKDYSNLTSKVSKLMEKKTGEVIQIASISDKVYLCNGKAYSFSTVARNFKIVEEEVEEVAVEEVKEAPKHMLNKKSGKFSRVNPKAVEMFKAFVEASTESLADRLESIPEAKPSKKGGKRKINNENYVAIAESVIRGGVKQKDAAERFTVDPATINDMLNPKYCRKSCKEAVIDLILEFGSNKLRSKWCLPLVMGE